MALVLSTALVVALACESDESAPVAPDVIEQQDVAPDDETSTGTGDTVVENDLECIPDCAGKQCGPDGCGGLCPPGCGPGDTCTEGQCVCQPNCLADEGHEKECGSDGCFSNCGICQFGTVCSEDFRCVPGGDLSCPTYFVCLDACPEGDEYDSCAADCESAVIEGSQELTANVADCLSEKCDHCADLECLQVCGREECGQDFIECFSGDQLCYEIWACVNGCVMEHTYATPEYESCRIDCLALGSPEEQTKYLVYEACLDEYCDRSETDEWDACEAHTQRNMCPNQTANCILVN